MTVQYMQGFETIGTSDDAQLQGFGTGDANCGPCIGAYGGSTGLVFPYTGANQSILIPIKNNNGFYITCKVKRSAMPVYGLTSTNNNNFLLRQVSQSRANGYWISINYNSTLVNGITYDLNYDYSLSKTSVLAGGGTTLDGTPQEFMYDPIRNQYITFYYATNSARSYIVGFTDITTPSTTITSLYNTTSGNIGLRHLHYDPLRNETYVISTTTNAANIFRRVNDTNASTTFVSVYSSSSETIYSITTTTNKVIVAGVHLLSATKGTTLTFSQSNPFSSTIRAIGWDGTYLVASGSNGELYISADEGVTFSTINLATGNMIVRYTNNIWLVSNYSNNTMYRCTGNPTISSNWSKQLFNVGTTNYNFTSYPGYMLRASEGYFLAPAGSGVASSSDGIYWQYCGGDSNSSVTSGNIGIYNPSVQGASVSQTFRMGFNTNYSGANQITYTSSVNSITGTPVTVPGTQWTTLGIDVRFLNISSYIINFYVNDTNVQSYTWNPATNATYMLGGVSKDLSTITMFGSNHAAISTTGLGTFSELIMPDGNFVYGNSSYQSVDCSDDGNTIVAVPYGTSNNYIWISKDKGTTWNKSFLSNSTSTRFLTISGNGNVIYCSQASTVTANNSTTNGLNLSIDGGNTWSSIAVPVSGSNCHLSTSFDGSVVLLQNSGGHVFSINTGTTWALADSGDSPASSSFTQGSVSSDGNTITLTFNNKGTGNAYAVSQSTNKGSTWNIISGNWLSSGMFGACSSSDGSITYVVSAYYKSLTKIVGGVSSPITLPYSISNSGFCRCNTDGSKLLINLDSSLYLYDGTSWSNVIPDTYFEFIAFGTTNIFNSVNIWDDIVITDYVNPNAGNPGDIQIIKQTLASNGTETDFVPTPSTNTNVQSGALVPYSASQSTYVGAVNVGDTDIYNPNNSTLPKGYRPLAVSVEAVVDKTFPNNPQVQLGLTDGTNQVLTPPISITQNATSPVFLKKILNADPSNKSWSTSSVNNTSTVIKKVG